jgi:hypothetical protein
MGLGTVMVLFGATSAITTMAQGGEIGARLIAHGLLVVLGVFLFFRGGVQYSS